MYQIMNEWDGDEWDGDECSSYMTRQLLRTSETSHPLLQAGIEPRTKGKHRLAQSFLTSPQL